MSVLKDINHVSIMIEDLKQIQQECKVENSQLVHLEQHKQTDYDSLISRIDEFQSLDPSLKCLKRSNLWRDIEQSVCTEAQKLECKKKMNTSSHTPVYTDTEVDIINRREARKLDRQHKRKKKTGKNQQRHILEGDITEQQFISTEP